jgi:hypothetical protein
MATTTLYVDGDIATGWDTTTGGDHFGEINEGTAAPNDADYIETTTADDEDQFSFGATPANTDTVTQVDVKVRGKVTDSADVAHLHVELWHTGATVQIGATKSISTTDFGGSGTLGTVTLSWTGLSLTKAQADSMTVKVIFKVA